MGVEENLHKWQDKLLDLGRGNQLLNFRESKSRTVKILKPDPDILFTRLSNGDAINFFDTDEYFKNKGPVEFDEEDDVPEDPLENQLASLFGSNYHSDVKPKKETPLDTLVQNYKGRDIIAYKSEGALKRTLRGLKRLADSSLTERGINILYVAFGFLKWDDKSAPKDKDTYYSPLLLIPISITANKNLPYSIKQYEDEVTANPSLRYKFLNDYNIELPDYDGTSNESLTHYLSRVQETIENYSSDWKVISGAQIGLFSYLKISMYQDIKDNWDKVVSNKAIRKILGNENVGEHFEPIDYDYYFKHSKEVDLHNVVDADSSQMEAIIAAKSGRDLVLQGPPGTGKSQTITNLIAEYLADGKKILFVSEKLAALEVVYNNLKQAGIADFCLELHSNKANKKDVVDELYSCLVNGTRTIKSSAYDELDSLKENKDYLDNYANDMHKVVEPLNKTPYELNGLVYQYCVAPKINYNIEHIETRGEEYYTNAIKAISKYIDDSDFVQKRFWENPWYGFNPKAYSYQSRNGLKSVIETLTAYAEEFTIHSDDLNKISPVKVECEDDITNSRDTLDFICSIKHYFKGLFKQDTCSKYLNILDNYLSSNKVFKEKKADVEAVFQTEIYKIKYDEYIDRFTKYSKNAFSFLSKKHSGDIKYIKSFSNGSKSHLSNKKILKLLQDIKDVVFEEPRLNNTRDSINSLFSLNPNLTDQNLVDLDNEFYYVTDQIKSNDYNLDPYKEFDIVSFNELQEILTDFLKWHDKNKDSYALGVLQQYFNENLFNISATKSMELVDRLNSQIDSFDTLEGSWIRFAPSVDNLLSADVLDFVIAAISNGIKRDDLLNSFSYLYYSEWQSYIYHTDPLLAGFNRRTQDRTVDTFKDKDKLRFEISKAEIYSKLTKNYPTLSDASIPGTEASILNREHEKKRGIRPVRNLLKDCGHLIQKLKPCFLMSPLSVSTYLADDTCQFDVVIFDEASQIFPWDAVGAIYRAKQVIVVGDSQQMPPSNYFNAELEDNEDEEDFDNSSMDFESILDICSATFESKRLNWHYRSKTEDLISFSNRNFYDNTLVTFPSVHKSTQDLGVDFYYVDNGVFDRKSKTNKAEVDKVVDLVFEHFKKHPGRSLGVVAFNIKQQEAIEDEINRRRDKDGHYEKFFSPDLKEPFFVKNLETVQGDERDTIIFSVAYAKDKEGKFYLNFGPLNREGGQRRLNVAVTRAKLNVKLIASIHSDDIDLKRTESVGVRLLKEYLKYAETGGKGHLDNITEDEEREITFEDEVANFLSSKGINFDRNVGCSSYRIDIAVKDPTNKDYVLAIECDGDTYASAKTTRDRDRLRQEVLEKLGWRFYRVWSSEWVLNPKGEEEKLLQAVNKAISDYSNGSSGEAESNAPRTKITTETSKEKSADEDSVSFIEKSTQKHDLETYFPKYPTDLNYPRAPIDYDAYPSDPINISRYLFLVVKNEQPITESLLLQRAISICNRQVLSSYVRNSVNLSLHRISNIRKVGDYYTIDDDPGPKLFKLRLPNTILNERKIEQISIYELAGGMVTIIQHLDGITKDGLYNVLFKLLNLGFSRLSSTVKTQFDRAYNVLLRTGYLHTNELGQHFIERKDI